jgi:hypothetical protein
MRTFQHEFAREERDLLPSTDLGERTELRALRWVSSFSVDGMTVPFITIQET